MIRQSRLCAILLLGSLAALVALWPRGSDLHHSSPVLSSSERLDEDYDAVEEDVIANFHQYFPRTDWETNPQFWKDKPYLPGDTLPGYGYRAMGDGREYILEVKNGTSAAGAKQVAVYAHAQWEQIRAKYMDVSTAHHFMAVVINENYTVLARLGKKQKGQDVY